MRLKHSVVAGLLLAVTAVAGVFVPPVVQANPRVKSAAVHLTDPTLIAGSLVLGHVLFEHDEYRMTRGEPCTVVYRFHPGKGPGQAIVAFHCRPRWGEEKHVFTMTGDRDGSGTCVLRAYQFAGDFESHGVPRSPQ